MRWRQFPRIFTNAASPLSEAVAHEARAAGPNPQAPLATPPQFSCEIDQPRYSGNSTVAMTLAGRPLYKRPEHLACRVGRKCRDEYLALRAQIRPPKRELGAAKFRHSPALSISADVYIGDM